MWNLYQMKKKHTGSKDEFLQPYRGFVNPGRFDALLHYSLILITLLYVGECKYHVLREWIKLKVSGIHKATLQYILLFK